MCEFKIFLKENGERSQVADGIVYGKIENNIMILRGLGIEKQIEGGIITEFNVVAEESAYIEITKSPIIAEMLSFIEKFQEYKNNKFSKDEILKEWDNIYNKIKLKL